MSEYDVIVVGAGNAALCAALSASEQGARVLVIERAAATQRGGNSAHSGGAFRIVYDGVEDIAQLVPDLSEDEIHSSEFGSYTAAQYLDDLGRLSHYRCDPDLAEILVRESFPTAMWLRQQGIRFVPIYARQAFKIDGKFVFWGGVTVEVSGGGLGLTETLFKKAENRGVRLVYGTRALRLIHKNGRVDGVHARQGEEEISYRAPAVVLASGGFHANTAWRAKYLGARWDLAKARGTRCNTGDGIRMALEAGALSWGNWSGCHSVFYDRNAPEFGDLNLLNQQKNAFWLGIVVNARGERFVDEGYDLRNYMYSRMGERILAQPDAFGYQIFDQQVSALLPDEYRVRHATCVRADTLEALAQRLDGVDPQGFLDTVAQYNAAVPDDIPFNPTRKDGRCTTGLAINKSNWALRLEKPPFVAYGVTAGVTCTYAGVRISPEAAVLSEDGPPMQGLYATGEMVGGLYYENYPGGSGLMSGSVFGRIAGRNAAHAALGARTAPANSTHRG